MASEVSLRAIRKDDAERIALLLNNKNIWDNVRDYLPHPYSLDDAKEFIEIAIDKKPREHYAISYKNELVGISGLHGKPDVYRRTGELGYWIGEPYWNLNIGTETIRQLVEIGFDELGLVRLEAEVYEYNMASVRILEKNGFEREGTLRSRVTKNGKIWDSFMYARINENN